MNDFKFLQTLAASKQNDLPETDTVQESEYRVYILSVNGIPKKIGVPVAMVEAFDEFIDKNEADAVEGDLSSFDIIEID